MNSPRDLRRRIRSIRGTSQITRAMQMVAASKMRKAQEAAISTRPFVQLLYRIQRKVTTRPIEFKHPLLERRQVRKRAVILVGADKGLCGALNANLFRLAAQFDPSSTVFITAGRRASQFVAATGRRLAADFPYGDSPKFVEARAVASFARDLFLKRDVDAVQIVATRFINTMTQEPVNLEFLPVGAITTIKVPGLEEEEAALAADPTEPLFEPGTDAILEFLLGHYINIVVFVVMLNAKASEQSARMMSMKNATDAAEDLLADLTLEYNKLRQGNITKELLEIAGGQAG
jgi:F-type H+-transporting ATPase subunit gamma